MVSPLRRSPLVLRSLFASLALAAAPLSAAPGPRVATFKPEPPTPEQFLKAPRDGTRLLLLGAIFDPTVQEPDFALVGLPGGVDGAYGIVQFKPGQIQAKKSLKADGVQFVGYLPDNAFQVRLDNRARLLLARHQAVRWMGPYQVGYKIHPHLWPGSEAKVADVTVNLFPGASLQAVRTAIAARTPEATLWPTADLVSPRLRYSVPADRRALFVAEAAQVSGVALIEPYYRPVPANNKALGPIQSNVPSNIVGTICTTCSIFNHGLTGTGQIAAVADTGNDSDMCFSRYDADPGSVTDAQFPLPPGTGTIDPTHKIIAYYVQPGATPYDGGNCAFHGTHTSATFTGDNFANLSTPTAPGIDVGDGMAPNAKLVFQDVGNEASPGCTLTGLSDTFNMYLQALNAGARVHSNSYGAMTGGAYTASDAIADHFLFDHEEMALFFVAGNEGPAPNTIRSPGNAKNVVTVGALSGGTASNGYSTTIANFSSRGPTDDGRRKPDIMAPGFLTSALGDSSHTSNNCGTQFLAGTSMATPTTAGGAALMRQYFEDGYYPNGSANPADALSARAALVKAALLNGTLPLPAGGVFGGNDYGWGRIFLDNNLFFTGDGRELRVWNVPNTDGLQTAGSGVYQVTVAAGQEFRVALVWSDPEASAGAGATLVNNLNLTVSDGTNTYLGNVFDASGVSIPGGTADVINNLEQVRLTVPIARTYTITVGAPTVPGNGRVNTDRQGYALVVSYAACATAVSLPPTGLAAVDHPPMGIDLSWTNAAGSNVTQAYRAVGDCSTAAKEFQYIGSSAGTTYTDTRAQGGGTYAYKVRGADGCGEGPASTCVTITPTSSLTVNNVSVTEGNAGTTAATFTVTLSPTNGQTVTADFATADGTATTANNDYVAALGTLTFGPGVPTQPIAVTVNGDTAFEPNETFLVNLSNPVNATITDGQGVGTILNDDGPAGTNFVTELFHGYVEQDDLAATGGVPNVDYYRIAQKPYSSYDVLVDATSGDIGPGLDVQRIGPDGTTVIQNSAPVSPIDSSRSLRWANTTAAEVTNEFVRVRSVGCTTSCGPDDVYGIRAFETTYSIPRFNNAGTQITVLLLQNPTNYTINGNIYFWDSTGALTGTSSFSLTAKQVQVLNTASVAPGVGGSVTVAHNGRYGDLSGKTVALEPATGFSFDSPMLPRAKVN